MTGFEAATHPGVYWSIALLVAAAFAIGRYIITTQRALRRQGTRSDSLRAERERLLRESQSRAEELHFTQEELRVANEDLCAVNEELRVASEELLEQSAVLRESQERVESQQAELERARAQIEDHSQRLALQNDQLAAARRDIDRQAAQLSHSNQYKSEFLANMSQELRSPLNSALILSKLLADNRQANLTPEQVKFARSIYAAGNDLLELINDLLDLSKLEARKVEIRNQTIELPALMEGLAQTFRPLADQKRLTFSASLAPDVPPTIDSDSQRLGQVLKNLLANAVKFTDRGSVSVQIAARGEDVEFAVRDTGIGRTGLGVSISRELAALLGGRIDITSAPGQGSTFLLTIPKVPPAAQMGARGLLSGSDLH